jgi:hypothetical protein
MGENVSIVLCGDEQRVFKPYALQKMLTWISSLWLGLEGIVETPNAAEMSFKDVVKVVVPPPFVFLSTVKALLYSSKVLHHHPWLIQRDTQLYGLPHENISIFLHLLYLFFPKYYHFMSYSSS